MKGQSPYTIKGYRETLRSFVKYTDASRLSDLTISRVESWICEGTRLCNWSPKTSSGRIKYMIVFANWLVREGVLDSNPLEGISLPRVPQRIPKRLSVQQAEDLLRYTRNCRYASKFVAARAYGIIATLLYTGVRKRELRDLELRDVDLKHDVLMVRQGKGAKDRIIPIPHQLQGILADYLKQRLSRGFSDQPFFFVGNSGRGRLANKVLYRLVTKLRKASGIYFAPHMLRHTYATLMLEGGCDLFSLSKLMGHADIKTTTIYLSATVKHLQEQVLKHPVALN